MNFPYSGAAPTRAHPRSTRSTSATSATTSPGPQVHADGEIWSAVNFDIRQALSTSTTRPSRRRTQRSSASAPTAVVAAATCPGNRRWIQIVYDAYLLMPTAPSMLDARDAYLAADLMRDRPTSAGRRTRAELWLAFARRGFGDRRSRRTAERRPPSRRHATRSRTSPRRATNEATVTFAAVAPDEGNIRDPTRGSSSAGTRPGSRRSPTPTRRPERGAAGPPRISTTTAPFAPGTYEFVDRAGLRPHPLPPDARRGPDATVRLELPDQLGVALERRDGER